MYPKNILISDFTYNLSEEQIAKFPLEKRDESKLLIYENEEIQTSFYQDLDNFLPDETLLIFNNTKVVEARLLFKKPTGGVIEIFCLEPDGNYADITTAMLQKGRVKWKCLIGGASKWKHGMILKKVVSQAEGEIVAEASIAARLTDCFIIDFKWQPEGLSFAELLHAAGFIPLPPYLNRDAKEEDKTRYQTIYAEQNGSVAAPTAGLHFTNAVFEKLSVKGIKKEFVTLHVGAGTFKPVKSEKLGEHDMHTEFIEVSADVIQNLINYLDKKIVAVGTTSLRTIESLYWMGVKLLAKPDATIDEISVQQWDPYEIKDNVVSAKDALSALLEWIINKQLTKLFTKTQILIAPGYSLRIAGGIITNFHQPQSTLLLLIAAIVGDDWRKIYQYALDNNYRFLSYGDGCLLWKR